MAGYNLEFGWDSSSSPNRDDTLAVLAPVYHRYYEVLRMHVRKSKGQDAPCPQALYGLGAQRQGFFTLGRREFLQGTLVSADA
jgi:hypothetical protein